MITPINNDQFKGAKAGDRVRIFYGAEHGEEYGRVYGRLKNARFGDQLRIKLDNYEFIYISGFVEVGVGAYLIKGEG